MGCNSELRERSDEPQRSEYTEIHMAMPVRIVMYAHMDTARDAARAAFARIAYLETIMSDYRPQSEVSRLRTTSKADGDRPHYTPVSPELFKVLETALQVADATSGAFDPTVYPVVALWRQARRTKRLPTSSQLEEAHKRVGWRRVALDSLRTSVALVRNTELDLGGVAKGYIIQDALRVLSEHGVASALIEAGGDIVASDAPPGTEGWTIDAPNAPEIVRSKASAFRNSALATSGPTSQFVEIDGITYSHVVDPRTGMALTNSAVSWVIASDATMADALSTAITVMQNDDSVFTVSKALGAVSAVMRVKPSATDSQVRLPSAMRQH